jgi:tagaturonate epimerase
MIALLPTRVGKVQLFRFPPLAPTPNPTSDLPLPRATPSARAPASIPLSGDSLPQPLGLAPSFGFDDNLGAAAPGHIAAARRFAFAPVLAQASLRQLVRQHRAPANVIRHTAAALAASAWHPRWGANAEAVRTETDLDQMAAAGFCTFTIDTSAYLEERADRLPAAALAEAVAVLEKEAVLPPDWRRGFLGRRFPLAANEHLEFEESALERTAVKFARAMAYVQRMARHLARIVPADRREVEISIAPSSAPVSPLEHLFCAVELKRRGVIPACLTLRMTPAWQPAVDIDCGADVFESTLRLHAAIARTLGPWKLGFSDADEKITALPVIGRVCGELMHVRSASLSYIEALRVAARIAPGLLQEILSFARERFEAERVPFGISTSLHDVDRCLRSARARGVESAVFDGPAGRHLLHVTCGSTLAAGTTAHGRTFREALLELFEAQAPLYRDLLDARFSRHLAALNAG